jgi:hypothetical protein
MTMTGLYFLIQMTMLVGTYFYLIQMTWAPDPDDLHTCRMTYTPDSDDLHT